MALQNVFEIDVDIKQKTAIRTPTVTQNDAVVFIFRVFDEGRIYRVQDGSTFTMTSTRPDKQAVMTVGEVKGENIVQFKLGTTELMVEGKVQAVIQVYDVSGRVSTIPFNFTVLNDPTGDYVPSEDEKTLIQKVLGEGPAILADAQIATNEANTAAINANEAAQNANEVLQGVEQVTQGAVEAATNANEKALLAEEKAKFAETATQEANSAKTAAETATSEAVKATEAINLVLPNVEGLEYIEPFNVATSYSKNNIVSYEGSSFISLVDNNLGNTPSITINAFWGLIARKGVDGLGSVVTVNGVEPDENGNVTIDLSGLATKEDLKEVNDKLTKTNNLSVALNRDTQIITVDQDTLVDVGSLEGKTIVNHAPLFDSGLWKKGYGESTVIELSNKVKFTPTTSFQIFMSIILDVVSGETFTVSYDFLGSPAIFIRKEDDTDIYAYDSTGKFTYTVPEGVSKIKVVLANKDIVETSIENFMLNKGTEPQPFVANIKGITNPAIEVKGKNLIKPFSEWTLGAKNKLTILDNGYKTIFNSDVQWDWVGFDFNAAENESYVINSKQSGYLKITFYDKNNNSLGSPTEGLTMPKVMLSPLGTIRGRLELLAQATNTDYTYEELMLNIGTESLPFTENNDQSITLLGTFHEGDKVTSDGTVTRKKKEVVLDGSLPWEFNGRFTDYKQVMFNHGFNVTQFILGAVKYNGAILNINSNTFTKGDEISHMWDTGKLYMSIYNVDSGWGENYTPTVDEFKAYFMGWKMANTNIGWDELYNGTGIKGWYFIEELGGKGGGTNTLPTTQAPINSKWQPYRLIHDLATPITEQVNMIGSISLQEGDNQIEVSEGRIIRERANPAFEIGSQDGDVYNINNSFSPISLLKNKIYKAYIYKNGNLDLEWKEFPNGATSSKNGAVYQLKASLFDPTAIYEVDYILLEPYKVSAPTNPITVEYQDNISSVVSKLVNKSTNADTRLNIVEKDMVRKDSPIQWIKPTLLNGWERNGYAQYCKDDLGFVHLKMRIKSGAGHILTLPKGFRPLSYFTASGSCSNGTSWVDGVFDIQDDGKVVPYISYSTDVILSTIFKAEQ